MEELTLEVAIEKNMNAIDCVRYYNPEMSEDEANDFLWNETCYPFDIIGTLKQIYSRFNTSPSSKTEGDAAGE